MWRLRKCSCLYQKFLKDRKQRTILNGQSSSWGETSAGVPQDSILGPLFFLVYINDLTENLKCNVKLFADDTSLFTVVQDSDSAANDMNHDLELIKQWPNVWRMSSNPDPQKEAVEFILSRKTIKADHLEILFNNTSVMKVDENKHFGIILDSNLSFSAHIKSAISNHERALAC